MKPVVSSNWLWPYILSLVVGESTLFNGQQASLFPTDAPSACLAAFNTTLACEPSVSLLYKQTSWVGWNASNLTSLCTSNCYSSLQSLQTTASSACGSWTAQLGGQAMDASAILDAYLYKYQLACLADGSTFCHLQLYNWDIPSMAAAGQIAWPTYTNKTYPDWQNDPINGTPARDENGTIIPPYYDPPPFVPYDYKGPAALDYYYTGGARPNSNLGWDVSLEYDEYPLEIQCSKCFQDRFKLGFMYKWGEMYTEVTAQIWDNMQSNCNFIATLDVHPALNQSGPPDPDRPPVIWTGPKACDQNIMFTAESTNITSCSDFALMYNIPSMSIPALNDDIDCGNLASGSYCAPLPCQVAQIDVERTSAIELLQISTYNNISLIQFMLWNPYAEMKDIMFNEVVCIGPPGGAYIPASTTVPLAQPTVYTTTATPAAPTPTGTSPNCGIYHLVQLGDYCNLLSLNYSITFDQLIAINPDLDSACSNLLAGYEYCVGLVNGTTAAPLTSTKAPPAGTVSSTGIPTSTTGGNGIATPTPTQAGMITSCNTFYLVVSGDGCYPIATQYNVALSDFYAWNPAVGQCTALYPGYYVCVGIIGFTTTTPAAPATTTSSTAVTTPSPIQPNMAPGCTAFYQAVSGDTCYDIAAAHGTDVATFETWNPDTGTSTASCGVWLGYWYCVAH